MCKSKIDEDAEWLMSDVVFLFKHYNEAFLKNEHFLCHSFLREVCRWLILFHYCNSSLFDVLKFFFKWVEIFKTLLSKAISCNMSKMFFAHQMICKQNRNKHKRLIFLSYFLCVLHSNIEIHFSCSCHYCYCRDFFFFAKKEEKKIFCVIKDDDKCVGAEREKEQDNVSHLWGSNLLMKIFIYDITHILAWFSNTSILNIDLSF